MSITEIIPEQRAAIRPNVETIFVCDACDQAPEGLEVSLHALNERVAREVQKRIRKDEWRSALAAVRTRRAERRAAGKAAG